MLKLAHFADARNHREGKAVAVLLSATLACSFLGIPASPAFAEEVQSGDNDPDVVTIDANGAEDYDDTATIYTVSGDDEGEGSSENVIVLDDDDQIPGEPGEGTEGDIDDPTSDVPSDDPAADAQWLRVVYRYHSADNSAAAVDKDFEAPVPPVGDGVPTWADYLQVRNVDGRVVFYTSGENGTELDGKIEIPAPGTDKVTPIPLQARADMVPTGSKPDDYEVTSVDFDETGTIMFINFGVRTYPYAVEYQYLDAQGQLIETVAGPSGYMAALGTVPDYTLSEDEMADICTGTIEDENGAAKTFQYVYLGTDASEITDDIANNKVVVRLGIDDNAVVGGVGAGADGVADCYQTVVTVQQSSLVADDVPMSAEQRFVVTLEDENGNPSFNGTGHLTANQVAAFPPVPEGYDYGLWYKQDAQNDYKSSLSGAPTVDTAVGKDTVFIVEWHKNSENKFKVVHHYTYTVNGEEQTAEVETYPSGALGAKLVELASQNLQEYYDCNGNGAFDGDEHFAPVSMAVPAGQNDKLAPPPDTDQDKLQQVDVYYELDAINAKATCSDEVYGEGDGIADRFQRVVTFKVTGGYFDDRDAAAMEDGAGDPKTTVEIRRAVTLDQDGNASLAGLNIKPTPNDGYENGSWDFNVVEKSEDGTETTRPATADEIDLLVINAHNYPKYQYELTYQPKPCEVQVNYFMEGAGDDPFATATFDQPFASTFTVAPQVLGQTAEGAAPNLAPVLVNQQSLKATIEGLYDGGNGLFNAVSEFPETVDGEITYAVDRVETRTVGQADATITFGHKENSLTVGLPDDRSANNTNVVNVYYAPDMMVDSSYHAGATSDQVPDKYQATISFAGCCDECAVSYGEGDQAVQSVVVTLKDSEGRWVAKGGAQLVPATIDGAQLQANHRGHEVTQWEPSNSSAAFAPTDGTVEISLAGDITVSAQCEAIAYPYTVKYFNGEGDLIATDEGSAPFGSTVLPKKLEAVDADAAAGLALDTVEALPIDVADAGEDNVITVTYRTDQMNVADPDSAAGDNIPDNRQARVEFVSPDGGNYTGATASAAVVNLYENEAADADVDAAAVPFWTQRLPLDIAKDLAIPGVDNENVELGYKTTGHWAINGSAASPADSDPAVVATQVALALQKNPGATVSVQYVFDRETYGYTVEYYYNSDPAVTDDPASVDTASYVKGEAPATAANDTALADAPTEGTGLFKDEISARSVLDGVQTVRKDGLNYVIAAVVAGEDAAPAALNDAVLTLAAAPADQSGDGVTTPAANVIKVFYRAIDKGEAVFTVKSYEKVYDGEPVAIPADFFTLTTRDDSTIFTAANAQAAGEQVNAGVSELAVGNISDVAINQLYGDRDVNVTANFTKKTQIPGTLTVTKRPVTLIASYASKLVGTPDPTFVGIIGGMGLVNSADLGSIVFARENGAQNAVGFYPGAIKATYDENPNYEVTVQPGDFSIVTPPLLGDTTDPFGGEETTPATIISAAVQRGVNPDVYATYLMRLGTQMIVETIDGDEVPMAAVPGSEVIEEDAVPMASFGFGFMDDFPWLSLVLLGAGAGLILLIVGLKRRRDREEAAEGQML